MTIKIHRTAKAGKWIAYAKDSNGALVWKSNVCNSRYEAQQESSPKKNAMTEWNFNIVSIAKMPNMFPNECFNEREIKV